MEIRQLRSLSYIHRRRYCSDKDRTQNDCERVESCFPNRATYPHSFSVISTTNKKENRRFAVEDVLSSPVLTLTRHSLPPCFFSVTAPTCNASFAYCVITKHKKKGSC